MLPGGSLFDFGANPVELVWRRKIEVAESPLMVTRERCCKDANCSIIFVVNAHNLNSDALLS